MSLLFPSLWTRCSHVSDQTVLHGVKLLKWRLELEVDHPDENEHRHEEANELQLDSRVRQFALVQIVALSPEQQEEHDEVEDLAQRLQRFVDSHECAACL